MDDVLLVLLVVCAILCIGTGILYILAIKRHEEYRNATNENIWDLKEKLKTKKSEFEELKTSYDKLETDSEKLKSENATLVKNLGEYHIILKDLNDAIAVKENAVQVANNENKSLIDALAEASKRIKSIEETVNLVNENFNTKNQELLEKVILSLKAYEATLSTKLRLQISPEQMTREELEICAKNLGIQNYKKLSKKKLINIVIETIEKE